MATDEREVLWRVGPRLPYSPFPQRVIAAGPAHALTEECIRTKSGGESWGEIGNGRALRLLIEERARLEGERDALAEALRGLLREADAMARDASPIMEQSRQRTHARALLARLGGEED